MMSKYLHAFLEAICWPKAYQPKRKARRKFFLYDWTLHYNPFMHVWFAFHREDSAAYWNAKKPKHLIHKDKSLENLLKILEKKYDVR